MIPLPLITPTEQDAIAAGRDAAVNGPTTTNCHHRYFATEALRDAWERGNKGLAVLEIGTAR